MADPELLLQQILLLLPTKDVVALACVSRSVTYMIGVIYNNPNQYYWQQRLKSRFPQHVKADVINVKLWYEVLYYISTYHQKHRHKSPSTGYVLQYIIHVLPYYNDSDTIKILELINQLDWSWILKSDVAFANIGELAKHSMVVNKIHTLYHLSPTVIATLHQQALDSNNGLLLTTLIECKAVKFHQTVDELFTTITHLPILAYMVNHTTDNSKIKYILLQALQLNIVDLFKSLQLNFYLLDCILHAAVLANNTIIVKCLLSTDTRKTITTAPIEKWISIALEENYMELAEILWQHLNLLPVHLLIAVRKPDVKMIQFLTEHGVTYHQAFLEALKLFPNNISLLKQLMYKGMNTAYRMGRVSLELATLYLELTCPSARDVAHLISNLSASDAQKIYTKYAETTGLYPDPYMLLLQCPSVNIIKLVLRDKTIDPNLALHNPCDAVVQYINRSCRAEHGKVQMSRYT